MRETFDGRFYAAYLGVAAKDVTLPLDFLPAGTTWEATVYADGPRAADDATDLAESTRRVTRDAPLTLAVAPEGGFVVVFTKVR